MFPSHALSLVPTLSYDTERKERGLCLSIVWFPLWAAEREAEDIAGHMGLCGGDLMTEWEAIPCYRAEGQHKHAEMYSQS